VDVSCASAPSSIVATYGGLQLTWYCGGGGGLKFGGYATGYGFSNGSTSLDGGTLVCRAPAAGTGTETASQGDIDLSDGEYHLNVSVGAYNGDPNRFRVAVFGTKVSP
jgi:hypothetical protein